MTFNIIPLDNEHIPTVQWLLPVLKINTSLVMIRERCISIRKEPIISPDCQMCSHYNHHKVVTLTFSLPSQYLTNSETSRRLYSSPLISLNKATSPPLRFTKSHKLKSIYMYTSCCCCCCCCWAKFCCDFVFALSSWKIRGLKYS